MMAAITLFVNLLPAIYTGYAELTLINQLNAFFQIDHNIFLLDATADINRFIDTKCQWQCSPLSLYVFNNIDGNITGLEVIKKMGSKNEFLVAVSLQSNFESNLNLLTRIKKIQRLSLNIKIGLFFPHFRSDGLRQLFEWSWENRIINIFAAIQKNYGPPLSIFTYNPFGTFDVINVTNRLFDSFFLSQRSNFQQHPLILSEKDNKIEVTRSFKMLKTVFRAMNASYKYQNKSSKTDNFSSYDIFSRIVTKSGLGPDYFYPPEIPSFNILVPEALPYAEFLGYIENILASEACIYASITIIVIMLLLVVVRYRKQNQILFFESVADVINLLSNDNCNIKYQRLNRSEGVLIVPLTFVGLVIINGILSNLKSHITQPFLQPQISTIEQIYRSACVINCALK